jgi:hypothetical protein
MSKILATIEGRDITLLDDGRVTWQSFGRIDDDGSGQGHKDKFHQSDTSLHLDGKPLDADVDRYIVVPPQILTGVDPVVLGCQAYVIYGNMFTQAVVGDIGPHKRLGEMSIACAVALGINPDPNIGGVDWPKVSYTIIPGLPAVVGTKTYILQPWA